MSPSDPQASQTADTAVAPFIVPPATGAPVPGEQLIERAARLKQCLDDLSSAYAKMPVIIEREHRAIRASDFQAVQACVDEKETAGAQIEAIFTALTQVAHELSRWHGAVRSTTLSESLHVLRVLADAATSDTGMARQVLTHQIDSLFKALAAFDVQMRQVRPVIEANRALVGAMLHNYRESYLFWLEIAEQVAASYNANGVQTTKGRHSGFRAKA